MTTLFDIAWRVSSMIGDAVSGTVESGTTTTLLDSFKLERYPENYFKRCPVFITNTTDSAAPQGEWTEVINYEVATSELTFSDALTAAVQSGDRYLIGSKRYPLDEILRAINATVSTLGDRPSTDETLSTAENKTEYDLPSNVRDVREVYIQSVTGDSDDNKWAKDFSWKVERAEPGAGSQDKLIFDVQLPSQRTIKIIHVVQDDFIGDWDDEVSSLYPPNLLISGAIVELVSSRLHSANDTDTKLDKQLQAAISRHQENMGKYSTDSPRRTSRLMQVGGKNSWRTSGQ